VVGGATTGATKDFLVVRYNADGSLDATFGAGAGYVATDLGGNDSIAGLALQPDGSIVAAGTWSDPNFPATIPNQIALARYRADGSLDASFGSGGTVTTAGNGHGLVGTDVKLQADGKVVVFGWGALTTNQMAFAVARYNPD